MRASWAATVGVLRMGSLLGAQLRFVSWQPQAGAQAGRCRRASRQAYMHVVLRAGVLVNAHVWGCVAMDTMCPHACVCAQAGAFGACAGMFQ